MKETASHIKYKGRYLSQKILTDNIETARHQQMGLMKAMSFRDKDLDANRSGVLSDDQRGRLRREQLWRAVAYFSLAFFLVLIPRANGQIDPMALFPGLFLVSVVFWDQYKTQKVLHNNRVESVSGPLSRRTDRVLRKHSSHVRKWVVDKKAFEIRPRADAWFEEGEHYTMYYVPYTDELLGAEPTLMRDIEKEKRLEDTSAEIEILETDETQSERLLE